MALERFRLDSGGARQLLRSPGVQRMLAGKARRVEAAVAAQLVDLDDWEVFSDVEVGRTRAGALISGVPMHIEAERRILGAALDAAR